MTLIYFTPTVGSIWLGSKPRGYRTLHGFWIGQFDRAADIHVLAWHPEVRESVVDHDILQFSSGIVKTEAMDTTDTAVERGSGNVFADLGLPDADAHFARAELVSRIDDILRERRIAQAEAARLLGLSEPEVSRLLRGDFREYSLESLLRLLTALGCDVDIVIRQTRSASSGKLRIVAAKPV